MNKTITIRVLIWSLIAISFSFYYGKSLQTGTQAGAPPKKWKEHWFEHNLTVSLVYYDDNVAVYYDKDVDKSVTWPFKTISDAWGYVKRTYGTFGDSTRLYTVFHQGRYGPQNC